MSRGACTTSEPHPPAGEAWVEAQDRQITDALGALDHVFNDPSPVGRLWGLTSDFISDKHFLNVQAVQRRDDQFCVLDVGCGTGGLLARLAAQYPNATFTGVDSNEASIGRARDREIARCTFLCASYDRAVGEFDIVVCSEVFEHVESPEGLLDVLQNRVKPGGYLSISTPSGWMYRTPRLFNAYKLLRKPRWFWRVYLHPENHWAEALPIHPGILPSKLRRKLEQRGFTLLLRQSALWWFQEPGVTEWLFRTWGTTRAAVLFFHLNQFMDAAMNVLPILRYGETRAVFLMRADR